MSNLPSLNAEIWPLLPKEGRKDLGLGSSFKKTSGLGKLQEGWI